MSQHPIYPKVIEAGKGGDTLFLDVGCMSTSVRANCTLPTQLTIDLVGTDVRKLVLDGYPPHKVLASDLREAYISYGHELFADSPTTCPIHFFTSDIFDIPVNNAPSSSKAEVKPAEVEALWQLAKKVDHLYAGALFHLFDEATQYAIAIRVAMLLKRHKGSVVFGRHNGLEKEGLIADHMDRVRYAHSPESWKRMWGKVFAEVEGVEFAERRVVVEAELVAGDEKLVKESFLYWSVSII